MISHHGDYLYVGGDDFDEIDIRGEVMPNSSRNPYPLRGEDPAFLMESTAERMMAIYGSVSESVVKEFTKKIDNKISLCNNWLVSQAQLRGRGFSFLNPDLDTSLNAPTTERAHEHDVVLGMYRDNFPNVSDEEFYPADPVASAEFHRISKDGVLAAYANQKNLVKCFRPAEFTQGTIPGNIWNYEDYYYVDGQEIERHPASRYVGENARGEFLVYYSGRLGRNENPYIPGGSISYGYIYGSDGSFSSDGIGLTAVGLPPRCKCYPVVGWRFEQHWTDYPKYDNPLGYNAKHFGYCGGEDDQLRKIAGNEESNTLTWTWAELKNYVPGPDWRHWDRPWHNVDEIPTDASFKKADGTYSQDYIVQDEWSVWCWPEGVIVELGDHTKWW